MQFSQVLGTESLVGTIFRREVGTSNIQTIRSILMYPAIAEADIDRIRFYIKSFLYNHIIEEVQKWLEGKDFDILEDKVEIKLFSKENILKNIYRGIERYKKMEDINDYDVQNDVEDVFSVFNDYFNNASISKYPLRLAEQIFNVGKEHYYSFYKDDMGRSHKITIPKECLTDEETKVCKRSERDIHKVLREEKEHVVSLFFFYMLGIQYPLITEMLD